MSTPTWDDAVNAALAAGWERVDLNERGLVNFTARFVRLWVTNRKGQQSAWEQAVLDAQTPAQKVIEMLVRDATTHMREILKGE